MLIKRRKFIQTGTLATATLLLPKFLKAFERNGIAAVPPGNKVVVILQLSGGNDGLNTVIPIDNDVYHRARPGLGIKRNKSLLLSDEAGLHPELTAFKKLYDDGSLGILNTVGYPDPDRSHFRSMDIWQTGSAGSEYITTGWIGRYLDGQCADCRKPTQALEIDDILSLALKGERQKGIAFKDPRRLYNTSHESYFKLLAAQQHKEAHERPVDYLYKTLTETLNSAEYIFEQSNLHRTTASYPQTELGNSLKIISSLILSDINTKVYYVSLGSFDTHVFQQYTQQRLFKQMNDAVGAFVNDLKANKRFDDVMLFTFSEFGRRVAQNASGGTDHGAANSIFLVSGGLQQRGLLNELPDLTDLDDGDLKYKIDFKQVYATILNKWLQADDKAILQNDYKYLSFI